MGFRTGRFRTDLLIAPLRTSRPPSAHRIALALFALVAFVAAASAQSPSDGAIAGHLHNESGAPMPYTLLLAMDPDSGLVQKAATGSSGEFLIPRLPPGDYILAIADSSIELPLPGRYTVHLGEVTEAEPQMRAGYMQAELPVEPSSVLTPLPVQGGDWNALAATTASSNPDSDSDAAPDELSFGGISPAQNTAREDGAAADDSFSGSVAGASIAEDPEAGSDDPTDPAAGPGAGSRALSGEGRRTALSYSFAQSAIREFRVHAQSDAAEYGSALYGHGATAVVTSVSRSGGTRLHGMAMLNVRNGSWSAANPFDVATTYTNGVIASTQVRPKDSQRQFAVRLSGPFITRSWDHGGADVASRLSYLVAFDRQLRDDPAISSPASAQFYRLTAMQRALLANRGVSAAASNAALNYISSLTGSVPRSATQTIQFARLDWLRTAGARAVVEYNRVRWQNPRGARSGAVVNVGAASLGSSQGSIDDGIARLFLYPTPHLTSELRLQYSHELQFETPQQPLPQEPSVAPGGFAPQVSIEPDGFLFGTPAALGRRAYPDERRLEAAEVLAWVHGGQLIQLGGELSELRDFTGSLSNSEGSFTYDSGTTSGHAGGLVDWITDFTFGVNSYPNGGCPSIFAPRHDFCFRSFSQSFGAQQITWHTRWALFAQDDWRLGRRLTLHLGARYEVERLPAPQHPNPLLDAAFGAFASSSSFPSDANNYGPRIGVAWQPRGPGRGTVRLGYGIYFGRLPGATIRAALLQTALPSSTTRIRITPTTETVCPQNPQVGFGYPCSFTAAPPGVAVAQDSSAMLFSRRFSLPAVQQGTFAIEHSIAWGVLGSATYVMNIDRQLPSSTDLNIAPSTALGEFQLEGGTGQPGARDREVFFVPIYTARRSPSFGPVTEIVSNSNATYNAITLEARRGLGGRAGLGGTGRGLEFRVAWTWSKALDFAPQSGAIPRANGQFDPFTNRYDNSLSALNFPHRIVATAVWSPRAAEATPHLRALLDDWSFAGIFTESSGRGYSYTVFGGTRLSGGHESINGSGGSTVLPTMGRNTLRLPDSTNLDLRLSRSLRMRGTLRLHAFADAFNLLNHVNYSGVTQRAYIAGVPGTAGAPSGVTPLIFQDANTILAEGLNTLPFGTLTDAGAGSSRERRIQLGMRVEF